MTDDNRGFTHRLVDVGREAKALVGARHVGAMPDLTDNAFVDFAGLNHLVYRLDQRVECKGRADGHEDLMTVPMQMAPG